MEVNSTGNPIINSAATALRHTAYPLHKTSDPYYKFEEINLQDESAQRNKRISRFWKLTKSYPSLELLIRLHFYF
jgi:hypothetical protein